MATSTFASIKAGNARAVRQAMVRYLDDVEGILFKKEEKRCKEVVGFI